MLATAELCPCMCGCVTTSATCDCIENGCPCTSIMGTALQASLDESLGRRFQMDTVRSLLSRMWSLPQVRRWVAAVVAATIALLAELSGLINVV